MLTFGRFYREYPSPCVAGLPIIYVRPAIISKFLIGLCLLVAICHALSGAAEAQGARQEVTLVALGDSLTAGYGLAPADGFAPKLETYLRARGLAVRVVNGGVSGDTSSGGLARFDWAVPDEADAIIVELGANDALRGINPDVTRANLTQIIEKSRARACKFCWPECWPRPIWARPMAKLLPPYIPIWPANMMWRFIRFFSTGWPRRNLLIWRTEYIPMPPASTLLFHASALTPSVSFQM